MWWSYQSNCRTSRQDRKMWVVPQHFCRLLTDCISDAAIIAGLLISLTTANIISSVQTSRSKAWNETQPFFPLTAIFSFSSFFLYLHLCVCNKSHLHLPGHGVWRWGGGTHTLTLFLYFSLSLFLCNKSLFNPRLDFREVPDLWPPSRALLSEGLPPNIQKPLFINVLLTSALTM